MDQMHNGKLMVVVQLEELQGTHREAREDAHLQTTLLGCL